MSDEPNLWDLFSNAIGKGPGPSDDAALELAAGSAQIYAFYASLVAAGFSADQALQLVIGTMQS